MSLTEIVFGDKYKEVAPMLRKKKLTSEEARKVLDSISHPEMSQVYGWLKKQIEEKKEKAVYSLDMPEARSRDGMYWDFDLPEEIRKRECLLFDDSSYFNGVYNKFCELLESAFPDYELAGESIGKISLERKPANQK